MEGVTHDEGMKGLSPVAARNLLVEAAANNGQCFNALDLIHAVEAKLEKDPKLGYLDKEEWESVIGPVRKRWEADLKTTVLTAFRDDMDEKVRIQTESYLTECEYLLDKSLPERLDSRNEVIPVDTALINQMEMTIFKRRLTDEERRSILTGLPREGSLNQDKTGERAKFDEGVKQMVMDQGSFKPEDVLRAFPLVDEKQIGFCEEAKDRLISEKGFCQTCASESLDYVAGMLRKAPKK
jgi:predicted Ser/Thr protein kinase